MFDTDDDIIIIQLQGGQTITDNFDRGDSSDLGTNWTVVTSESAFNISSNTAIPSIVTSDCAERYSGVTWSDNQSSEVEVTLTGVDSGAGLGVIVRCASGARTYYRLVINALGGWTLGKNEGGSFSSLASGTTTYSAGAILKLSAIGTTITSTYNGTQLDSRTDTSISSGSPGISLSSVIVTGSVDDWVGKDGL